MNKNIIIGTRGSELALWQAYFTRDKLLQAGYQVEIKILKTQGDVIQDIPLHQIDGKGFFTKELEQALLDKVIDLAVHSHKDLPTVLPSGLCIAGTSYRHDSRDALLIRNDAIDKSQAFSLKKNAIVGTSSPRRAQQINFYREDISLLDIRGNVPTRIQKLQNKQYDAILLAVAGLERLALKPEEVFIQYLSPRSFIPAAAQGVLAYETRDDDATTRAIVNEVLHDEIVAKEIQVERKILHDIDGGCKVACGIYTEYKNEKYHTWGFYQEGEKLVKSYFTDNNPDDVIDKTVKSFLQNSETKNIFISTSPDESMILKKYSEAQGWNLEALPLLDFERLDFEVDSDEEYYFFSSKKAVTFFFQYVLEKMPNIDWHSKKYFAIGNATALKIKSFGFECAYIHENEDKADFYLKVKGKIIVFPSALSSLQTAQNEMKDIAICKTINVYENKAKKDIVLKNHDLAILTSPMNVRAYFSQDNLANQYIAIGDTTASEINKYTQDPCITAFEPSMEHVINSLVSFL